MGGVIFLLIVIGILALYFGKPFRKDSGRARYDLYSKDKTEEQKKVLRYFLLKNDGGCLAKETSNLVSDSEFNNLVDNFLSRNSSMQEALDRVGIDESQVQEVKPINFWGFTFDANYRKWDNSWNFKSSSVQTSWLFFSKDQVYLFQKTIKLDESSTKFRTEEYFYKDIVNFSTRTEERELIGRKYIDNTFSVIVPGDKFDCTLPQNMDSAERSIQGMKAKLREKKNA
jgi:hypothetical protein